MNPRPAMIITNYYVQQELISDWFAHAGFQDSRVYGDSSFGSWFPAPSSLYNRLQQSPAVFLHREDIIEAGRKIGQPNYLGELISLMGQSEYNVPTIFGSRSSPEMTHQELGLIKRVRTIDILPLPCRSQEFADVLERVHRGEHREVDLRMAQLELR